MTGKPEIQRIRVDAQGYDQSGAYWGAGPDVFIASLADGRDEIAVRARTMKEAQAKIAAERDRKPGEPRTNDDRLGGNPPRKTRYEISWTDPMSRDVVQIRVTHARDYLASGSDHVEVESIRPKKAPLPITETGYRSHFMAALELVNAGGPVTFVTAWLDREASSRAWAARAAKQSQGDLFAWADAKGEVAARKRSPKPKAAVCRDATTPKSKHRRKPAADPE